MPAKLHWCTACQRVTTIVWRSRGLRVTILLQRVNICPSMHQTRSPQCFKYGINERILFEVGMRSEIEPSFVEGMTDHDRITPISSSSRSAAVITKAIEVDNKAFKSILPFEVSVTCTCINKLHCGIPCLLFVLKIVRVINFRGFYYPRKFFLTMKYFQTTVLCYYGSHIHIAVHPNIVLYLIM